MPDCDVALQRHEAIRGITKMEQQHYKDMKHYVALRKWNNNITKTGSIALQIEYNTSIHSK
jgi:hypothetical protein